VNRTTFYANYEDIYDLADKLQQSLEQMVIDLYPPEMRQEGYKDFLPLFRHIRDNQLFYKTYFKLGARNPYMVTENFMRNAAQFQVNDHVMYHMEFFRAGLNALLKLWLANGCRETPEEMMTILTDEYGYRLRSR